MIFNQNIFSVKMLQKLKKIVLNWNFSIFHFHYGRTHFLVFCPSVHELDPQYFFFFYVSKDSMLYMQYVCYSGIAAIECLLLFEVPIDSIFGVIPWKDLGPYISFWSGSFFRSFVRALLTYKAKETSSSRVTVS